MRTIASGISENRFCLAGRKLIDILHHWLQVKSVFNVLECSFQMILHWWAPNQRTNADNAMQVIREVYLDIQTPTKGNTGI